MSDPRYDYDTEFWFNATLYTAYEWHGDFDTVEDTREAFDAWLDRIRAEAWGEGNMAGRYEVTEPADIPNPYREEAD